MAADTARAGDSHGSPTSASTTASRRLPPDAERPDRRRAGRPAPQPLHRRLHHPRPRPLRRAPSSTTSPSWRRYADPPRPRLRPARQDLHGPAALRAPARARRLGHHRSPSPTRSASTAPSASSGSSSPTSSSTPAALRWLAARARRRPRLPLHLLRRLRARRRADGRGAARGRRARPVDVVVELGAGEGARTGVRTEAECAAVADAVAAAGTLRLVGVAGYEGEVPEADPRAGARLAAPAGRAGRRLRQGGPVRRTPTRSWSARAAAPGSTRSPTSSPRSPNSPVPVLKLLRSGAYVSHDDGHYRKLTPFNRVPEEGALQPAFRLWAQVVSRPSPEQAFVNAGKRDAAYDLDLPEAQVVAPAATAPIAPGHRHRRSPASPTSTPGCAPTAEARPGGRRLGRPGPVPPVHVLRQVAADPVAEADGTVTDYIRTFF